MTKLSLSETDGESFYNFFNNFYVHHGQTHLYLV